MPDWAIDIITENGLAGLVLAAVSFMYYKATGEIKRLNKVIFDITKDFAKDQKDMTVEVLDNANNWREVIKDFFK